MWHFNQKNRESVKEFSLGRELPNGKIETRPLTSEEIAELDRRAAAYNAWQRELFEKSFERPVDYFNRSPKEQWEIDRKLGILGWHGYGLSEEDLERYWDHYDHGAV